MITTLDFNMRGTDPFGKTHLEWHVHITTKDIRSEHRIKTFEITAFKGFFGKKYYRIRKASNILDVAANVIEEIKAVT